MFASSSSPSSNNWRVEPMDAAMENNTETIATLFSSTVSSDNEESIWEDIKSFFNSQNTLIVMGVICILFFIVSLCLLFIIVQLLKKKRVHKNDQEQRNPTANTYPKFDQTNDLHFPFQTSTSPPPRQMGLTSNQIASLGSIPPGNNETTTTTSVQETSVVLKKTLPTTIIPENSGNSQSFDTFEDELKRTWREKGIASSTVTDDEVETVNEVLGMEERGGKVYYKVNFAGHPTDYTAWVCEEDLIPE